MASQLGCWMTSLRSRTCSCSCVSPSSRTKSHFIQIELSRLRMPYLYATVHAPHERWIPPCRHARRIMGTPHVWRLIQLQSYQEFDVWEVFPGAEESTFREFAPKCSVLPLNEDAGLGAGIASTATVLAETDAGQRVCTTVSGGQQDTLCRYRWRIASIRAVNIGNNHAPKSGSVKCGHNVRCVVKAFTGSRVNRGSSSIHQPSWWRL